MWKHWRAEEFSLACNAYADCTRNHIQGANQRLNDFSADLLANYKVVSPTNCDEGRYYLRGEAIYPYLHEYIFPGVQNFQKVLQIVDVSGPSGTIKKKT